MRNAQTVLLATALRRAATKVGDPAIVAWVGKLTVGVPADHGRAVTGPRGKSSNGKGPAKANARK